MLATEGSDWEPISTRRPVPGTTNLRDLGGTPVHGGHVAPGRLLRAEALVRPGVPARCAVWTPEHAAAFTDLGVRTVIDLRGEAEADRTPSIWPEATGARHVTVPIHEGGAGDTDFLAAMRAGRLTSFTADDLADFYAMLLRHRAAELGTAIRTLADPGNLPALVHCAAGKDRTGLVIALVLEALGAARDVVVADYALTEVLHPDRVDEYAADLAQGGVAPADVVALFGSPPDALRAALAGLDEEFGGPPGYLSARCGVDDHHLAGLLTGLVSVPE